MCQAHYTVFPDSIEQIVKTDSISVNKNLYLRANDPSYSTRWVDGGGDDMNYGNYFEITAKKKKSKWRLTEQVITS